MYVRTYLSVDEAEGVREGPESDTTETPESVRSAGGRRELLRRLPGSLLPPELPPSLLVPVTYILKLKLFLMYISSKTTTPCAYTKEGQLLPVLVLATVI